MVKRGVIIHHKEILEGAIITGIHRFMFPFSLGSIVFPLSQELNNINKSLKQLISSNFNRLLAHRKYNESIYMKTGQCPCDCPYICL